MNIKNKLSSNLEDYLEAILLIKQDNSVVRVRDLAAALQLKMPSVTSGLKTLVKANLVKHEKYGYVELTTRGERLANDIQSRHNLLVAFFTDVLSLDEKVAEIDACKIEHQMSRETFKRLANFIEFIKSKSTSSGKSKWLDGFRAYIRNKK